MIAGFDITDFQKPDQSVNRYITREVQLVRPLLYGGFKYGIMTFQFFLRGFQVAVQFDSFAE